MYLILRSNLVGTLQFVMRQHTSYSNVLIIVNTCTAYTMVNLINTSPSTQKRATYDFNVTLVIN